MIDPEEIDLYMGSYSSDSSIYLHINDVCHR